MSRFRYFAIFPAACVLVSAGAQIVVTGGIQRPPPESLNGPRIVVLPTDDFVWHWGDALVEERLEPNFSLEGSEEKFFCRLTASFGSNSPDKQALASTLHFIQEVTARMNDRFRLAGRNSWATLSCAVPDVSPTEQRAQERIDSALERAENQRDRRRRREARDEQ